MESGVEGDHLRHIRENLLASPDTQQVSGIVERGEVAAVFNLGKDILVHDSAA